MEERDVLIATTLAQTRTNFDRLSSRLLVTTGCAGSSATTASFCHNRPLKRQRSTGCNRIRF